MLTDAFGELSDIRLWWETFKCDMYNIIHWREFLVDHYAARIVQIVMVYSFGRLMYYFYRSLDNKAAAVMVRFAANIECLGIAFDMLFGGW